MEAAGEGVRDLTSKLHLEECGACRELLAEWQEAMRELSPIRNSGSGLTGCPSMDQLANYVARNGLEDGEILDHLSVCERCCAIVREALRPDDEAAAVPALRTGTGRWRREFVAKVLPPPGRAAYGRRFAIAGVLLIAAAGAWWGLRRNDTAETLLASAYTAARPFEYRLPDRGYGPVRVERGSGSAFDRPAALNAAEVQIQRRLAANPGDATALSLKGRADLMERNYEQAIDSLTRALESRPEDADALASLGTAYAARGDAEKRNIDYGHATDLLLQALKKRPGDARVLFNLGIVYEKLWLVDEAIEAWHKLLDLKPERGWADEAREHLDALEKIRREKKKADAGILKDPSAFLAEQKLRPEFDAAEYHETFWGAWLPAARSRADALEAARIEAREYRQRFGDPSLEEILDNTESPAGEQAVRHVVAAIEFNRSGKTDAAISAARAAATEMDAGKMHAGASRARVELAYGYRRASKYRDCIDETNLAVGPATVRGYRWIAAQAHLEHAACVEAMSRPGLARAELSDVNRELENSGLRVVSMRARTFMLGVDDRIGNYLPVWDNAPAGLHEYWASSASPYRAQDLQYYLQSAAAVLGWNESAAVIYRASIHSLEHGTNPGMEALNRVKLAGLLQRIGDAQGQAIELATAFQLLGAIDPGPARDDLEWTARMDRTQLDVAAGNGAKASAELQNLVTHSGTQGAVEQMRVQEALGLALLSQGDSQRAQEALEKAIEWNQRDAASLAATADRVAVLEKASKSYRNLALLQAQKRQIREGFRTWLLYRGEASENSETPTITWSVLPGRIAVWRSGSGAPSLRFVDASVSGVEGLCRRFNRLCADPLSNETEVRETGNTLFHLLIAPELTGIAASRIVLRTDSWLGSIPVSALTDDAGRYLAGKYSFAYVSAPRRAGARSGGGVRTNDAVLIVSAPAGTAPGQKALPVLESAEREANDVGARFPNASILKGPGAGVAALARLAAKTKVLHFAGHGWANGGNGALILPSGAGMEPQFLTSTEIASQEWRHCELVVLSACLTAASEERGSVNNQSLVRAFLSAGARQVIAARWSVDSNATRALFNLFYDGLLRGEATSESLSRAASQIAMRPDWKHPYYWSAFDVFTAGE